MYILYLVVQFSHSLMFNPLWPWTATGQASRSIPNSWSLLKLMCIESTMPSNHLILCHPFLLLASVFPSIRVFSSELTLQISWPKYWSFSFSISPSMNIQGWFPFGLTGWISFQSNGLSRVFSNTRVQKHQFFGVQPSLWSNFHIHIWLLEKMKSVTFLKKDFFQINFNFSDYFPFKVITRYWI